MNKIIINECDFKITINGVEFIAKHNKYTKFSNFDKYARKMLNEIYNMDLLKKKEEDFYFMLDFFDLTRGNTYYSKKDMRSITIALYKFKWGAR